MRDLHPAEKHPDVGSARFVFGHKCNDGCCMTLTPFAMKIGDSPDFWKAKMLMPGAVFEGMIGAVFEASVMVEAGDGNHLFDGSAAMQSEEIQGWMCWIKAGRSVFWIQIHAHDRTEAQRMCREIGAFRLKGEAGPSWLQCVGYRLSWLWRRRPTVRLRSPIDIF